jgi:hypothetical protein
MFGLFSKRPKPIFVLRKKKLCHKDKGIKITDFYAYYAKTFYSTKCVRVSRLLQFKLENFARHFENHTLKLMPISKKKK